MVLALKMEIFVEELEIICMRECGNVIRVHAEARGDAFVRDCCFGLTMLGVVVVEMQGESSAEWEIRWRCQWGEQYRGTGSWGMTVKL